MKSVTFIFLLILVPSLAVGEDRPSVEELVELLNSNDRDDRRDGAHQLAEYGPGAEKAIPSLIECLKDRDIQIWHDTTQALAHLGPKAEPALDALMLGMASGDDQRRFRTAYAIGSIGKAALPAMRQQLNSRDGRTREVAVRAIGYMGTSAAPAAIDLIPRLNDKGEHIQDCAVESLANMGPVAVEVLAEALRHQEPNIRAGAARTLGAIGNPANSTLGKLISLSAEDEKPAVRAAAVAALGRIAPADFQIIPPLLRALQDHDNKVKRAAVEAWIPTSKKVQREATPQLVKMLDGNEPGLRLGVLLILNRFGPQAASATPKLLEILAAEPSANQITTTIGQIGQAALEPTYEALRREKITPRQVALIIQGMPSTLKREIAKKTKDESPIVRELAASTLGDLVPFPVDGTELLKQSLNDDVAEVRLAAARSIQKVEKKASGLWGDLIASMKKENNNIVATELVRSLSATHNEEDQRIEQLVNCLEDRLSPETESTLRVSALSALGELELLPAKLQPTLGAILTEENPEVRSQAIRALARVRGNREQTAEILIKALDDPDMQVRTQAMQSLSTLGNAAIPAIAYIQARTESESQEEKIKALNSLSMLGNRAASALHQFVKLTQHENPSVRKSAYLGLRSIAKKSKITVETLTNGLSDEDWEIRKAVARELGELEELATPAVPALLKMLRRDDESDEARRAIRDIGTAGAEAVPVIIDILQDPQSGRRTRYYSLYLLRKMEDKAKDALPILLKLRDKEDGQLGDQFDRAIESIEDALKSS